MKKQNIFLTGASGFVGREILKKLLAAGHAVKAVARNPRKWEQIYPQANWIGGDFNQNTDAEFWQPHLDGIAIVINAAGIIRETKNSSFANVHHQGPLALFTAARKSNIEHVLQVSALGADAAVTRYQISKKAADDFLLQNFPQAVIIRPSIVTGEGGQSIQLFSLLSSLPLLPLVGDGSYPIQPVLMDDLTNAIAGIVAGWPGQGGIINAAGPQVFTLQSWLQGIRQTSGLRQVAVVAVPLILVEIAAKFGIGMLDQDTLTMLKNGSTADVTDFTKLLNHPLRSPLSLWDKDAPNYSARLVSDFKKMANVWFALGVAVILSVAAFAVFWAVRKIVW